MNSNKGIDAKAERQRPAYQPPALMCLEVDETEGGSVGSLESAIAGTCGSLGHTDFGLCS